jgi:hypothetical protein
MMTSVNDKFEQIKIEAGRLLAAGRPTTAAVLQIFQHLTLEDADRLARGEELDVKAVSRISAETDLKPRVVSVVAARTIRLDLSDSTHDYQSVLACYREAGSPALDVEEFLGRVHPGDVCFLLHGPPPCMWESRAGELCDFFIEHDEDNFDRIVAGHLVAKGMAFGTSVEALRAALEQRWPNWQAFWAMF